MTDHFRGLSVTGIHGRVVILCSCWAAVLSSGLVGRAEDGGTLSHQEGVVRAHQATVNVDGKLDGAWEAASSVEVAKIVESVTTLPPETCVKAKVRFLWNPDYLYFLADVKDGVISTANANDWAQDSVEIFLDQDYSRSRSYDEYDCQYRISAIGDVSVGGYAKLENIVAKVVPISGGYRVEASIKPNRGQWKLNQKIGLELQVNNDPGTGQRESVTKWHYADNNSWLDTSNFGTLILTDGPQPETAEDEARTSNTQPNGGDQSGLDVRSATVPDWAADAVFYQIFPERFRNGDPHNDPTRESLEFPDRIPPNWKVMPWTGEWYRRADWEQAMGPDFYDHGVFHRRYGGDLQGIIDKLDYLSNLGINAIYLNPIFYARSLHKYDGNSFHHVDPYFGPTPQADLERMAGETADPATWTWTAADQLFLELLQQAHDREIRVIIDGVFNHTGRDFFAFRDIIEMQQESEYRDWYIIESFDDPQTEKNEFRYKGWWGVQTLPEFADNPDATDLHPGPKAYVMAATRRWMDPNADGDPSDGIDGWRLDVANEVPNQFWLDWNRLVRELNPKAYTVAEIWDDAASYLPACGFSATMNYHGFSFPAKGFLIDGRLSATAFVESLQSRMEEHRPAIRYALQNLYDSHDTDRVASMIVNARHQRPYKNSDRFDYDVGERVSPRWFADYDLSRPGPNEQRILRLAVLFQMTFVGPPMIYYGTEAGMDGADDPDDRMPMVWEDLTYDPRTVGPRGRLATQQEIRFDHALYKFFQEAIQLRRDTPAFRRGSFEVVLTDDDAQVIVFGRQLQDERYLIAINRGENAFSTDLGDHPWLAGDATLSSIFSADLGHHVSATSGNSARHAGQMVIPSLGGSVWRVVD